MRMRIGARGLASALVCVLVMQGAGGAAWAGALEDAEAARERGDCAAAIAGYREVLAGAPSDAEARRARKGLGQCLAVKEEGERREAAVAAESRDPWYHDPFGWGLVGGGLLLLAGATVVFLEARSDVVDYNDVDEFLPRATELQMARASHRTQQRSAVAMAGGGALVLVGLVRFGTLRARRRAVVAPAPAPSGTGAMLNLDVEF